MQQRSRAKSLPSVLVGLLGLAACDQQTERKAPPSSADLESLPLVLEAGAQGRFVLGCPWSLHVEPDGRAALFLGRGASDDNLQRFLEQRVRILEFTVEDLDGLRVVLGEQRFFELPTILGRGADDGDTTWIDVRLADRRHRVDMQFIDSREIEEGKASGTVDEVDRARRVWAEIARHVPEEEFAARTPAWERRLEEQQRR